MREIPGHGLMIDGHDTPQAEVLTAAGLYLVNHGMHPLDADEILARERAIVRAWWGGDEVGFVGEDHPNAQPVTVVHCPLP